MPKLTSAWCAIVFASLALTNSVRAQIVLPSGQPDPAFPSLAFWLDADDAASFSLSGNVVNSWADRADGNVGTKGGGGTLTRQTAAINGRATVQFDGNAHLELGSAITLASGLDQTCSAFVVAKSADDSGGDTLMSRAGVNVQFFRQNNGEVRFYKGTNPDPTITTDTLTADRVRYAEFTGGPAGSGDLNYFVNGTELTVANSANIGPQDWQLDRVGGGGGCCGSWGGDIAEIILYDRALTTAEQNAVGAYLANKYAIATTYAPTKPLIGTFSASDGIVSGSTIAVPANSNVTLSWNVTEADTVTISPAIGAVASSGSQTVNAGVADSSYTLTATNVEGDATAQVEILIAGAPDPPRITEFLANTTGDTLEDEDADNEDWIEISNPNGFPIDIGGYYLTDDPAILTKWQLPSPTTLGANEFLVVFASSKDRAVSGSQLHTNFKLSSSDDHLALVADDGTTVLSNFTWSTGGEHPSGVSYGLDGNPATEHFFSNPSPGLPNAPPYFLEGKVLFSEESKTFSGDFTLTLTPEIAGSEIRYTTDRSVPDASSPLYTAPLNIATSTLVRARTFDPANPNNQGNVSARSYIRLSTANIAASAMAGSPTLSGFTSNLPIVVLDNFGGATANRSDLRPTSFTMFDPVDGVASISDVPSISTRSGYRIRGASSAGFPKKQYRVELRNQEDFDKSFPLGGLPSDSDWVLSAPYTDKALIRNPFIFALGRELGLEAPRTRHIEVFLNEDGGDLDYETDYRGVYILIEQIKISNDRVDLTKISPSDNTEPNITGGYIARQEFGASSGSKRLPNTSHTEMVDPDAITQASTEQKQWLSDHLFAFDDALDGPDFKDPILGYEPFIDVPSFVNLFVINELGRDQDGYMRSNYFHKDRNGKIVQGPLWDYNLIMGNGCCRNTRSATPTGSDSGWQYIENNGVNEWNWEVRLDDDEDFWQKFIDRWQELRRDVMSDAGLAARMDIQATGLAAPAVRNFAKWDNLSTSNVGFQTPVTNTWEEQVDFMKAWSSERMEWIDSQFTPPPTVSPVGGVVAPGSTSTISGTTGTIYYTTDGTDPRLPGGAINPAAQSFSSTGLQDFPLITRASTWDYLADGSDQGSSEIVAGSANYSAANWKHPDFDDSSWSTGTAPLGYSNSVTTTIPSGNPRNITNYFRATFVLTDAASILELDMEIQYDDGAIVYLNGKEIARENLSTIPTLFDTGADSSLFGTAESEWHEITLDPADLVEGTNVIAIELHQQSSGSSDTSIDFSLNAKKPAGNPPSVTLNTTSTITARALTGTDWSGAVSETYIIGDAASASNLVVSEIHYHPAAPDAAEIAAGFTDKDMFEYIELMNVSTAPIDLSLVRFSDGFQFEFPANIQLAPGGRTLIVRNGAAFAMRHPGVEFAGEFAGDSGLSNGGEPITLLDNGGVLILSFTYNDKSPWPEPADGDGFSLVLVDPFGLPDHSSPFSWRPSVSIDGTPGDTDATTFSGEDFLTYATGGSPPTISQNPDRSVSLTFPRNLLADDVAGQLEVSLDLADWQPAAPLLEQQSLTTYRTLEQPADSRLFFRYRVILRE